MHTHKDTHTHTHTQTHKHTYTHTHTHKHAPTYSSELWNCALDSVKVDRRVSVNQGVSKGILQSTHISLYICRHKTHIALKGTPSKEVSWPKNRRKKLQMFPVAGFVWLSHQYLYSKSLFLVLNVSAEGHSHVGSFFYQ